MRKLLLFALLAVLFTSCAVKKQLTSTTPSNEITKLAYFEPLSYVRYVEKGNIGISSDSLSNLTQVKLDSIIEYSKSTLHLTDKLLFENDSIKAKIENELGYLSQVIQQRKKLDGIPITPVIHSVLKNNKQRFALATVATGFERRKGNYGGQVAKGFAIGLLSLGMYIPTPIKSNLTLYAFIFDLEKNEIAFYKKEESKMNEPTNAEAINKQFVGLFNGYFYEKN